MCSLVNAKSGGCAEDCGFCAQSRYAEADTPDARDDGARRRSSSTPRRPRPPAPTASAWSPRARASRSATSRRSWRAPGWSPSSTNLKRCASIGHMSADRARQLKEAGIQRVHHNVESSRSYYPEVSTTVRYEGRLRTIDAVKEAGLETCVGGILNLGESPRQRVEMAFELAEIEPGLRADQPAQPAHRDEVRRPRADGPVGRRQVGGDLPADPARRPLPALRRPRREPAGPGAARRQGRAQRRDDGQLPDHPRASSRPRTARCSRSSA